jgi:hypothetical protein
MKYLFSSPDTLRVGFIRSLLEAADIRCETRNEAVSQVMVGLQFAPELWVQDQDYKEAALLVAGSRAN